MRISDWSSDVCSSDLAYDPHYHYQLALDAGMSAYAAPLGMIEAGADSFAGQLPTILKVNSANSWATARDQAVTGGVDDALRLGCAAIGFPVYPGSEHFFDLAEAIRELSVQAEAVGTDKNGRASGGAKGGK